MWLLFQIFIAEDCSRNLVAAALIVLATGAYWLWTDCINTADGTNRPKRSLPRAKPAPSTCGPEARQG